MQPLHLKANGLVKHNVDSLLKARGQTRHDLAVWCRRSDAWISKLMSDSEGRNIQLDYLDRIADFFGIATYQLLQPGISPLTERRKGTDRRKWRDRRVSQSVLSEQPGDVDLIHLTRALSREGREKAIALLADILNSELRRPRATPTSRGAGHRSDETAPTTAAPDRGHKTKRA